MAAFVLLLFTFMMERRQSQQQIDDLKQSASTVQTLQGLIEENQQLKEQLEDQKKQLGDLQSRFNQLESDYNTAEQANIFQGRTAEAMDWFWQIDEAYVRGRTNLCRELIASLEGGGLAEYLPTTSATNNDRFSPYDRYQEIRGRVIK